MEKSRGLLCLYQDPFTSMAARSGNVAVELQAWVLRQQLLRGTVGLVGRRDPAG